eukprot:3135972-Amphidinium_carterae.1
MGFILGRVSGSEVSQNQISQCGQCSEVHFGSKDSGQIKINQCKSVLQELRCEHTGEDSDS